MIDFLLFFKIVFVKNLSVKLLLAMDEQHPRPKSSGVAARTRVFSQTQQSESEVVTLLVPLLLFQLFPPCPATACGTKPTSTQSHRTPIPIGSPSLRWWEIKREAAAV